MNLVRNNTSRARRALTWLLVLLMVFSLLPAAALAVSGSTVAADGSYTASGNVSFSKDSYSFNVTVTVKNGVISNLTQKITSSVQESKSETKYQPSAASALLADLKGKSAAAATVDALSSGTPKYSYAALKTAVKSALASAPAAAVSTPTPTVAPTAAPSGDVTITNPATARANGLSLTKTLSYDSAGDTWSITLEAFATEAGGAVYTVDGYDKDYSYSQLCSGNYYYYYNGTYYQVHGLKYYSSDKGKDYYVGYFTVGKTTYYLDKTPKAYSASELDKEHPGDDKASKAYSVCKKDKVSDGKKLPLYTCSGSGSGVGSGAVLRDVVNTNAFDVSGAKAAVTSGSASAKLSGGTLTVTGYDYTANYGGKHLVVVLSGLTAKTTGTVQSNSGNAAVYADSSLSSALVSVASPTASIPTPTPTPTPTATPAPVVVPDPTEDLRADGVYIDGSVAVEEYGYYPVVTITVSNGKIVSITADVADSSATDLSRLERAMNGVSAQLVGQEATTAAIAAVDNVSKATYSTTAVKNAAIIALSGAEIAQRWSTEIVADGVYTDDSVPVEDFDYVAKVTITVKDGVITAFTAELDDPYIGQSDTARLNLAVAGIADQLIGQSASEATVAAIDNVSGATHSTNALRSESILALGGTPAPLPEEPVVDDGRYNDATHAVADEDGDINYIVHVNLTVEDGIITAVTVEGDADSMSRMDARKLAAAADGIAAQLVGQRATRETITGFDNVSSATLSSDTIRAALAQALDRGVLPTYTVIWKNADGAVLETDFDVVTGSTPRYDGETPTIPDDETHTYTFSGWDPEPVIVKADATYTAVYTAQALHPLAIVAQPEDYTGVLNEKAVFSVQATGDGLTYQWYYSDDGGATWTKSNSTAAEAACKITKARDGRLYYCVVTDQSGSSLSSEPAALHWSHLLEITQQPADYTGAVNEKAVFSIEAAGEGLTYQWYYSDNGGASWSRSSATTPEAACKITPARDGRLYYCVVKDNAGSSVSSEPAAVHWDHVLTITEQPTDYVGEIGTKATFTVKAVGDDLTYQWYYSDNGGASWVKSNSKTATAVCAVLAARGGRQYYCVITDSHGAVAASDVVTLNFPTTLAITRQPEDFTGAVGATATFTVQAEGEGLTYQWYYSDDGGASWKASSAVSAVATCKITAARDGRLYRCYVAQADGAGVTSSAGRIVVEAP